MKILAVGPFLGDFKNEILQFLPYSRWLSKVVIWDKIYLSTHINRRFLYDFIPEENFIPVFQQFSRDEKNQKGYIHKKINKNDFKLILKSFKEKILEKEKCNRGDIEIHHLSYSKNTPPYSIYNKIFKEIKHNSEIPEEHKNQIIFIPAKKEKIERLAYVYNWMRLCYNVLVVGNMDTWFSNDNVILNKIDYFESGFSSCISYINEAKAVITPLSYWTTICNLQKKPVFSWGQAPGQYREGGIYNFGNKKCITIPSDKNTNLDIINRGIDEFLKM